MDILKELGKRLRELRQERELKQREMADLLEMTLRNYQRMEHGEINVPVLTLCTLADYFGVTTEYLLGRTDVR
ncbi:MAG: helix-turn-helix transcriptional regulator [Oscillospiraceae bacterium]|nr:helix-turn-helix transcriptional regulator [Oscillospiraceae bacterium]